MSVGSHLTLAAILLGTFLGASLAIGAANRESRSEGNTPRDSFQERVQPILVRRCFECHSHDTKISGGLALDSLSGLEAGGQSGPAIIPGAPGQSLLIMAVTYTDKDLQMPPKERISDEEIAILVEWVQSKGAASTAEDPSATIESATTEQGKWEALYKDRLTWWSLQPLSDPSSPRVREDSWARNDLDRFVLAELEKAGLPPGIEAGRRTLARRLSFTLLGLPPTAEEVERFVENPSETAYEDLVASLLGNPHFGERWARHWMDVVHYSDTHGYEWDTPAKNAWMYRDYLIRAFNEDVPFNQLILEQIAGDLIEPRVDPESGLVESLIGPTAMRLGERRHGDNADAEGVSQEATANIIDTLSKGFLATTVACAQCHDHKLDAVEQRDYFGLAGLLMSTRWIPRTVESTDPNLETLAELSEIKEKIRGQLSHIWDTEKNRLPERIATPAVIEATPSENSKKEKEAKRSEPPPFPPSAKALWESLTTSTTETVTIQAAWEDLANRFESVRSKAIEENRTNLVLIADFTRQDLPAGWRIDGFGMDHGWAENGDIVIADEGDAILSRVLPSGRWSDLWSKRLEGAVRSPLFAQNPPPILSVGYAGGAFAAQSLIVDNAFHSERMKFPKHPRPGWLTLDTGNLTALAGGPGQTPRRVYLELVTKSLNNYFPPRSSFGGVKKEDETDARSWFGVTKVYQHPNGKPPADELERFAPLFSRTEPPKTREDLAAILSNWVVSAVDRWRSGLCGAEDVRLINDALEAGWLTNHLEGNSEIEPLVKAYRETEKRLQPSRVIGSVEDWNEGANARVGIRGSYTALGDEVPRGNIRFLGGPGVRSYEGSSGRLEFAKNLASDENPLTARVFVNRVWHYLFGEGLVRTVDDFGHLGEKPSHPELLDWLASRFIEEGWSLKKLVKLMVTSATWRQMSIPCETSLSVDPENRLLHHFPMRRLEAEAVRDSLLAVSGRLDPTLYGPPIDPYRAAEDPAKRLFKGPLDGQGRRSIYTKMTLMEPPRFLALFNQPIPKTTTGRRDATSVPDQALAMLNDPLVIEMARFWSQRLIEDDSETPVRRVERMFLHSFARPPKPEETERLVTLVKVCADLREVDPETLLDCQPVWQDVAHALFNLKEFIYVQ